MEVINITFRHPKQRIGQVYIGRKAKIINGPNKHNTGIVVDVRTDLYSKQILFEIDSGIVERPGNIIILD